MGGTIRFVTVEPKLDRVEGSVAAELSSTEHAAGANYDGTAIVNLPLIDGVVGMRAGVSVGGLAGYVDRLNLAGTEQQNNTDHYDHVAARLSTLVKLSDTLTVKPLLLYQEGRLNDLPYFESTLPDFEKYANFNEPQEDTTRLAAVTVRNQFQSADLTSITSWSRRELWLRSDYGNFFYNILAGALYGVDPSLGPLALHYRDINIPNIDDTTITRFSEEIRVASTDKTAPLQWIVGAYFEHARSTFAQTIIAPGFDNVGNTYLTPVFGFNPFDSTDDTPFIGVDNVYSDEYAPFGDLTYRASAQWSFSAGVRWFKDKREVTRYSGGLFDAGPGIFVNAPTVNNSESGFDPRYTINYQATPSNLLYASAARGFRPGGANPKIPDNAQCNADAAAYEQQTGHPFPSEYGPDYVWSYEIGSKNMLAEDRLMVNGALFYLRWQGIQEELQTDSYANAGCGFAFTDNVGQAVSKGAR